MQLPPKPDLHPLNKAMRRMQVVYRVVKQRVITGAVTHTDEDPSDAI